MCRSGRTATSALVAFLVAAVALSGPSGSSGEAGAAQGGNAQQRPNIVLLESDDQTQDSMRYMPTVNRVIGEAGATFPTNVTNWPLCCPSRATLQTGQYAHNHDVLGNSPPLGGFGNLDISNTLPVWLQSAGDDTAHIGKFLNGYESSSACRRAGASGTGRRRHIASTAISCSRTGASTLTGSFDENPDNPADPASYSTDVYTEKAVDLINRRAQRDAVLPLRRLPRAHAGCSQWPLRGHGEARRPPRRRVRERAPAAATGLQRGGRIRQARFDRRKGSPNANQVENATRNYRCRAESLLAIDESVGRVVDALRSSGELRNTLVIYTSDNGFFHGEHRIVTGKNRVYEEAVRVPLLMRGPGVPKGVSVRDLSINADLVLTIADAAGAKPGLAEDGVSLLPFAAEPQRAHGRELLIEQYSPDGEDGEPAGAPSTRRFARRATSSSRTRRARSSSTTSQPIRTSSRTCTGTLTTPRRRRRSPSGSQRCARAPGGPVTRGRR